VNQRLYRSRRERVIAGVAGGVADHLNVDPAIVRVIWAVLVFTTGGVFGLIYIVMWVVVPEAPPGYEASWPAAGTAAPLPPDQAGAPGAPGEPPASGAPVPPAGPYAARPHRGGEGRLILGAILIVLGVWFLVRTYIPQIAWDRLWPILLVVAGVALLVAALGRRDRTP
jgi:phage shock protein PspC (stress-responsive transcriptional regulator)